MASTTPVLQRLVRFYSYYAPEKVCTADIALEAYSGREDAMFRALERKYGLEDHIPLNFEPNAESGAAERGGFNPRSRDVSESTQLESMNAGGGAEIGAARRRDGGRNQALLEDDGYGGMADDEDDVYFDAERDPVGDIGPAFAESDTPVVHFDTIRNRLERIYTHYCPERLESVDMTLAAYQGREDVLFRVLERKYGPEPKAFLSLSGKKTKDLSRDSREKVGDESASSLANVAPEDEDEDISSLRLSTSYDMAAALLEVGFARDRVRSIMNLYGTGREKYAVAVALLVALIGRDALFDMDDARPIVFPRHQLQLLKRSKPDLMDHLAFEHILVYRAVYLAYIHERNRLMEQRDQEARAMHAQFSLTLNTTTYRHLIVEEAIRHLPRIEHEERATLQQVEEGEWSDMQLAFRRGRLDIVRFREAIGMPIQNNVRRPDMKNEYRRITKQHQRNAVLERWEDRIQPRKQSRKQPMVGGRQQKSSALRSSGLNRTHSSSPRKISNPAWISSRVGSTAEGTRRDGVSAHSPRNDLKRVGAEEGVRSRSRLTNSTHAAPFSQSASHVVMRGAFSYLIRPDA